MDLTSFVLMVIFATGLLYMTGYEVSDVYGWETDYQTGGGIGGGMKETPVEKHCVIFIDECGKCGESTAESNGEKHPPMLSRDIVTFE